MNPLEGNTPAPAPKMIPHPDEIRKSIEAKTAEFKSAVRAQRKLLGVAYTVHGVTPPPKKAKKKAEATATAA